MEKYTVRVDEIVIKNFKNVEYGMIDFKNSNSKIKASVLGIYGQNGSGKTTVIDSLKLLKLILMGSSIPLSFADCINVDCDSSTFMFKFRIEKTNSNEITYCIYSFSLKKIKYTNLNSQISDQNQTNEKVIIFDEKLSYSLTKDDNIIEKMQVLIDSDEKNMTFEPRTKLKELVGNSVDDNTNVIVAKKIASSTSKSFIFSREMLTIFREKCKNKLYLSIFESLVNYGHLNLFIFDNTSNAIISLDTLPLSLRLHNDKEESSGIILLPINGNGLINKDLLKFVKLGIDNINIVLCELVPGLKIDLRVTGEQLESDGSVNSIIHLVSNKNDKAIPLRYESEGIKKIIAILNLLINVYNNSSITVCIDELDSGIFEYLLGEILSIICQKGKGQLIFTSHNLRPLETLDKSCIVFTTTNPKNRYVRFTNVKRTNNLRDLYYRNIILGENGEYLYEKTNNHQIAYALREAGENNG